MAANTIRDLRESKGLSRKAVRDLLGWDRAKFLRVERNGTPEEVAEATKALRSAKKTGKTLAGRPLSDPVKAAAVKAAREAGESVLAVLAASEPVAEDKPPAKPRKPRAPKGAPAEDAALI